jgi:hypothetical protein
LHRFACSLLALGIALAATACSDDAAPASAVGAPGSPTFAGVRTLAPDRTGQRVLVTWAPATDDKTPAEQIKYRIYVSTHAGHATANPATLTTDAGATRAYITVSPVGVEHHVVVHAVDGDGLEDGNSAEKSVLATADTTPPTFAGLKTATLTSRGGVALSWGAATDDRTDPEAIRYAVAREGAASLLALVEGQTEVTLPFTPAPGGSFRLEVRAIDAADNMDANASVIELRVPAPAPEPVPPPVDLPPSFAGCGGVQMIDAKTLRVTWAAATDDGTPADAIRYDVYSATTAGGQDFSKPAATKIGKTEALLTGLSPGTTYHIVCRARDSAGNQETNSIDFVGTTSDDVKAPTFGGINAAAVDPILRTASLSWNAAADDKATPGAIVYVVYEAKGTDPFDFTSPLVVTAPGVVNVALADIPSRSTLRWVVRARDPVNNEDTNIVEMGGTTQTSWSVDVQPLFSQNCAVVGCHSSPNVGGGIPFSLSAFNAYESIVSVTAAERPLLKRISPGDSANSYLYQKVTLLPPAIGGNPMPAPGTGNVLTADQKDILKTWIDQGALRN